MNLNRPQSIAELASGVSTFREFSYGLADFLHQFAMSPGLERLLEEPAILFGRIEDGEICDAYLAATAGMLANRIGKPAPEWTEAPARYLKQPWFASPGHSMRACLLLESPARFRERNLFVTANAIDVA